MAKTAGEGGGSVKKVRIDRPAPTKGKMSSTNVNVGKAPKSGSMKRTPTKPRY